VQEGEMIFKDFISWAQREMQNWREFETLGEVKRRRAGKALKGKKVVAKYDTQQRAMLWKLPFYDKKGKKPVKIKTEQLKAVFDRFMEASPDNKITSSYYQIQTWKAPEVVELLASFLQSAQRYGYVQSTSVGQGLTGWRLKSSALLWQLRDDTPDLDKTNTFFRQLYLTTAEVSTESSWACCVMADRPRISPVPIAHLLFCS